MTTAGVLVGEDLHRKLRTLEYSLMLKMDRTKEGKNIRKVTF
jgi:hypothetical protein